MDLLQNVAARHDAAMDDLVQRKEWLHMCEEMYEQTAMPFGPDPGLREGGELC
ncbi:MAG: hypothetical protein ABI604_06565 [Nitrospirota bacterium]